MPNLVEIVAVDGQVVFDLPFTYTPTSNDLFVFWNGQLLYVGVQYTETSPTQVTLLGFAAQAGDNFTFRIPPSTFLGLTGPTVFGFAPRIPKPLVAPELFFTP
jgi:hypothetical protein